MKKRAFALAAALCVAVSLAGCGGGSDTAAESGDKLGTVKEGVLTVATSPDFAPYEFYAISDDGEPVLAGIDISLAGYIADRMGLTLEIVTMDFDGVISELQGHNVDLAISGLVPSADREGIMDFSDSYYTSAQSIVTTQEKAAVLNSFESINSASVSVGVQNGSIQAGLAEEYTPDADIVTVTKVTDMLMQVLDGTLDAAYVETGVAGSWQKLYPDLAIVLDVPYEQAGVVVGVSRDNAALLSAVNEAIAAALSDGSIDDFAAKAAEQAEGSMYEGMLDETGEIS